MASCFCGGRAGRRRGSQFVKLVFPGGHVELLHRPVQAAEVMAQHPRFCVARPDVFREPVGAVAAPDAMLHASTSGTSTTSCPRAPCGGCSSMSATSLLGRHSWAWPALKTPGTATNTMERPYEWIGLDQNGKAASAEAPG
jgi:hypothetical protein